MRISYISEVPVVTREQHIPSASYFGEVMVIFENKIFRVFPMWRVSSSYWGKRYSANFLLH